MPLMEIENSGRDILQRIDQDFSLCTLTSRYLGDNRDVTWIDGFMGSKKKSD